MQSDNPFMEENIKLAEVLRREFKSRNLSVSDISKRCAIPIRTLRDWYSGSTKPSAKTLHYTHRLAEFLRVSLHYLLFNIVDEDSRAEVIMSATFKDGKSHYKLTIEKLEES